MSGTILGPINAVLPKDRGVRVVPGIAYGRHDRHVLDLYLPHASDHHAPVIMFAYGGAWHEGARQEYGFVGHAFAARGYVTVIADYRLYPEVRYPAFLEDLAAATCWVTREAGAYGGDPERLFLMGHSAGAYNAVMLALAGERYGAGEILSRVLGVVGLSGPYDFYPFDLDITINTFGAAGADESSQPVNLVTPGAPPMLLVHGGRDRVVYPRNTIALAARLRGAGVDVVEKHHPGLGHPMPLMALARPFRWRAPVYKDVLDFLGARALAGRGAWFTRAADAPRSGREPKRTRDR